MQSPALGVRLRLAIVKLLNQMIPREFFRTMLFLHSSQLIASAYRG